MSLAKTFITKAAPHFEGVAYFRKNFQKISLSDYKGKYLVFFFYPLDFTFVCPTEIIDFAKKAENLKKINCEVLGCSVDSHFSHMEYCNKPRKEGGLGELEIPLLSDLSKNISRDYGVLLDSGLSLRGTFIIDKNGVLRHIGINDTPVGRNVDEVERLVQAFQHSDVHGEVCPASWKPGDKTMVADHNSSKTQDYWQNVHNKK